MKDARKDGYNKGRMEAMKETRMEGRKYATKLENQMGGWKAQTEDKK